MNDSSRSESRRGRSSPTPVASGPSIVGERGSPRARAIGSTVGLGLGAFFLAWPGLPLDPAQRGAAAVTALVSALWATLALPLAATSLLPAALFPLLGVSTASRVAESYAHELVLLFLGAFVLALGLERWGVPRRAALRVVQVFGASPRALCLGFMATSALLSMWISNTATTLILLPIATAVLASVECDERERGELSIAMLLGIAYAASIGGTATPVGTAPNIAFLSVWKAETGGARPISFGTWMIAWLPLSVLFVPLAWFLLTRVLHRVSGAPDAATRAQAREVVRAERARLGPLSRAQLAMGALFVTTALLWVTRRDLELGVVTLPGWSRLLPAPDAIGDSTVALAMAALAFVLPARAPDGERTWLVTWRSAERLPWEVVLLFGGGFAVAGAFQDTGLAEVLGDALAPLMVGRSTWTIVFAAALLLSFLTEVTSNTATTFVLLPVAAAGARAAGLDPLVVMAPVTLAASLAFMLPVATPPNAIVTATRLVPPPIMARTGFALNLLGVVLVTIVFQLWARARLGG